MKKRIVLCLDGTWNSPEQDRSRGERSRFKPTNVLKTYRAVSPVAADGTPQVAFYLEGVGAFVGEPSRFGRLQSLADRLLGGLFGGGFEGRVKAAYRFLAGNFEPGDDIFVFGFSRGAAQARSFARFVEWTGGVLAKRDEYYIPELFDAYRASRAEPGAARVVIDGIRARRAREDAAIHEPRPTEIAFLGVYDTVLSLGSRLRADRGEGRGADAVGTVERKYSFHVGPRPPAIVRVARQALAIDERRWDYRPQVWTAEAPGRSLEQRWFPGAHSNVGGGYDPDGLANFPLRWMLAEARAAGLETDRAYLGHFRPSLKGKRPDELRGGIALAELLRGKLGRGRRALRESGGAAITIDPSALRLLVDDASYRPSNLLAELGVHPPAASALAELSGSEREALAALLAG